MTDYNPPEYSPQIIPIREWPDPILQLKSAQVEEITPVIRNIVADMTKTLAATGEGVGLAAPQIGHSLRIVLLSVNSLIEMINPEIVKVSKSYEMFKEGCLSFPGKFVMNKRHAWVAVEFLNLKGERVRRKLFGLEAFCLQHEMNHLDGLTLADLGVK